MLVFSQCTWYELQLEPATLRWALVIDCQSTWIAEQQIERSRCNHAVGIKQEGRLSLSLDSGSIALVREHFLFRDLYHRTGRISLNVTVRHSALCVVLVAKPTSECVYGSARHIKPRRYRERTPQTAFKLLDKFCNKASYVLN